MIPLELLPGLLDGQWLSKGAGAVTGASIDTRALGAGQAFFAIPGTRVDGHDFLPQAAERGASVAIVERDVEVPSGLAVLRVADVRAALWGLAQHYRTLISARVVAVMGSNGKTTTVRMLEAVLKRAMATHASARSFNNALGLPLTILSCPPTAEALVCELGEGEPGALARYVGLARPDVAIVTSVGRAHVGELGGMDAVRREFSESLAALAASAKNIVPDGEAWLHRACSVAFAPERAWHELGRVRFELADGSHWTLPVPGLHNADNAAAVIAAARELGMQDSDIANGLERFEPAEMRLAVREVGGTTVIVDCYNANPDSMAAALRTLADVGERRRTVAVVGDMLELGSDSEAWHRQMGELAANVADECVFIGERSKAAFEAAGTGAWFATVDRAREAVVELAMPGTVVLLKASRGMAFEKLLEGMDRTAVA